MSKKRVSIQVFSNETNSKLDLRKKQRISKKNVESSDDDGDELNNDELNDNESSDNKSNDDESSDDESNDEESNLPKLKKRKKNINDNESFANAINSILNSKLKAHDRKNPILIRSKQIIKNFENKKLESKAQKALLLEKKKIYDKDRIKDLLPKENEDVRIILNYEKNLKKIAQKGVIKLFNVLLSTQNKSTNELLKNKTFNEEQKQKLITEISKEKFFNMIKTAGEE